MSGEITPHLPDQLRDALLYDSQMPPIDLINDEVQVQPGSGGVLCKQRITLKGWSSPGTLELRAHPDLSPLIGYPQTGHEPGHFFTLDEEDQPHEYTVGQIFPFNPPDIAVDERPADILDWKSTGRLTLGITWDHDPYFDARGEFKGKDIKRQQEVDSRIGELPIAIKIGRVTLFAIPDVEALMLQQGLPNSTSYEHFVLYGKTDYFTGEPDAPDVNGYVGSEVIVPLDLERLKSAKLLFLNPQLTPILSKATNLGLSSAEFLRILSTFQTPQVALRDTTQG